MLRFHFTSDDLARVRIAPGPDPMWETMLSGHLINELHEVRTFGEWRSQVVADLPRLALPYLHLTPSRGYSPDFLTPSDGTTDFADGLDEVLFTPRDRLRTDVDRLGEQKAISTWASDLGDGLAKAVDGLGATMSAYHAHAIEPYWSRIRAAVDADLAGRARTLAAGGVVGALSSLHPTVTWEAPVLTIRNEAVDRDVHLAGRGLRLLPSYFCWGKPMTFADSELEPVLLFPIDRSVGLVEAPGEDQQAPLARLLGRTRAAALQALVRPTTTSGLARRLGVSLASASEHATVLRRAGLIRSTRCGNQTSHELTTLAHGLLSGSPA
jgi:DNA-binding transcriptional ArsR family regulator